MVRAITSLKLGAAVLALVAIFLGGHTNAANAAGPTAASLENTAWVTTIKTEQGKGILLMVFNDEGEFVLTVANTDGDVLKKIKGTYTVKSGKLTLFVDGKKFATEEIVTLTRNQLVTEDQNEKQTIWKRYTPSEK
jgi:uncharacterized protein (TIGR03066 family)